MHTRGMSLLSLLLLLGLLVSPGFTAPEDQAATVVTDAIKAFTRNDAEAARPLLMEGCVLVTEGLGMDDQAMVASAEQVLAMLAQTPAGSDVGLKVKIDEEGSEIHPDVSFVRAEVSGLPEMPGAFTVVAALVSVAEKWQIALMGVMPKATLGEEMPPAVRDIVTDLAEGETTGMQSALDYLPTGPCVFVVGGPEFLIPLAGPEAIRRQVGEWAPPANVQEKDEAEALAGKEIIFVMRGSTFDTEGASRYSQDLLCLHNEGGKWKIVAFIARSAPAEGEAAEGKDAEERDRQATLAAHLLTLQNAVDLYNNDMGTLPKTLEELARTDNADPKYQGPYIRAVPRHPYGGAYGLAPETGQVWEKR